MRTQPRGAVVRRGLAERANAAAGEITPRERPIIFRGEMVRAILAGRKTQTRRIVRPQPAANLGELPGPAWNSGFVDVACPHGRPGDRLWVRETWAKCDQMIGFRTTESDEGEDVAFAADKTALMWCMDGRRVAADTYSWNWGKLRWRPSIHMPRWASRLTLEITDVRVERLQEISEKDAQAEGAGIDWERVDSGRSVAESDYPCVACSGDPRGIAELCHPIGRGKPWRCVFANLWDAINGKRAPWAENPWIWAMTFRRVL